MYRVVKRNERFGAYHAFDILYLVVEQVHKMLVVTRIELDEHGVRTGGEVTLDDFGYLLHLGHNFAVQGASLEVDSDICTCRVPEFLGVHRISGAGDDLHIYKALDALVDGGATHSAFYGYVFGGYTRISHYNTEYFAVKVIDLFHLMIVFRCF